MRGSQATKPALCLTDNDNADKFLAQVRTPHEARLVDFGLAWFRDHGVGQPVALEGALGKGLDGTPQPRCGRTVAIDNSRHHIPFPPRHFASTSANSSALDGKYR